jgi:hypothetical protein
MSPVRQKLCSGPCGRHYPVTYFWSDAGAPDGHMSRCPECEKEARRARREAREQGEAEGKPDRNGRKVHFSDEERQRRSELAKRLHSEGRLGGAVIGARGGRAVNRHRITDAVLEHFRQPDQQAIVIKALEGAFKGKSKHLRLAAFRELRMTEEKSLDRERADRGGAVDPASMTREELLEFAAQGIEAMIKRGEIPADFVLGEESVEEIE